MNSIKKKIEWDKYIIALSPIFLIFYISNETYAIDYRAFYLNSYIYLPHRKFHLENHHQQL